MVANVNPANGSLLYSPQESSKADVDQAVARAQAAFPDWSQRKPSERARILLAAAELLEQGSEEIAEAESRDTGKPVAETSLVDVPSAVEVLRFYAHLVAGGGMNGETVYNGKRSLIITKKLALGVCAGIGAW